VSNGDTYTVEPWSVRESHLHLDRLAETESVFALSNGHVGVRGNLDEGEPHGVPGTYLNGFFEAVPLPYAEGGYGYPEEGQSLIDVTNGKLIRLLVDDESVDVRHGDLLHHERVLDLRSGLLDREARWQTPTGKVVEVRSTRMVSFVHRAVMAVRYEVRAVEDPLRIVVQSTMVANEPLPERDDDPRAAAALRAPLVNEYHTCHGMEASLGHHTRTSGLRMAAAMGHLLVDAPPGTESSSETEPDLARVTISTDLAPGESMVVVKLVAYGWSSRRSMPALRDQVDAALEGAKRVGWDGLVADQRRYLDDFWDRADIEVEGDDELQQAVRFALFQVLQASARNEQRAVPAKGLTGRGYDGHTFWDLEAYVQRMLTYTAPDVARDALRWRHSILPLARARAHELRLAGAAFPWRTIRGEECSGYWPAGTAAFHLNAGIADAVRRYVAATGDDAFEEGPGLDLLVETARLWASLGHHDAEGCFRIDGVTGPDEYTALVDNNVFTNLMAARNLRAAAEAVERYPGRAMDLDVDRREVALWLAAADQMVIPFDEELGVTAQSEGFTRYRPWDFAATPSDQFPLLLHYPYYLLYSSQVVKQADLVFALYSCGDAFTAEQKRRDFAFYERITVRDSSLSACIQAVVAAEVGQVDLAYEYLRESALVDLHDVAGNTGDGVHLASLAGAWLVVVAGFGGLRDHQNRLSFSPSLPTMLSRLTFRMVYRGRRIKVELVPHEATYHLLAGEPIDLLHDDEEFHLTGDEPLVLPFQRRAEERWVEPPSGREALRRGVGADTDAPVRQPEPDGPAKATAHPHRGVGDPAPGPR
jgi:alpha,alpha-trehalose phosphorylase